MDSYPFIAAKAALLILAAVLIVEYAIRRRKLGKELMRNRQKQQQLAAYSEELKNLKKEFARKSEIAEKLPLITKKMTEKLPSDAYPAIAVRSVREKISATDIAIPGTEVPVRITVSGGLAMSPTHGQSTPELFRAADDALYESKQQGRNRILLATSVGLDGGIVKGTDAVRETPVTKDISVDTESDAVEFPLGELGGDFIASPAPRKLQGG